MARPTSRPKSKLSRALIELRSRLGESQQTFSNRLEVSMVTVSRWERDWPPRGSLLRQIRDLAREKEYSDLALIFEDHLPMTGDEISAAMNEMDVDFAAWEEVRTNWTKLNEILETELDKKRYAECELLMKQLMKRYRVMIARRDRQIRAGGL